MLPRIKANYGSRERKSKDASGEQPLRTATSPVAQSRTGEAGLESAAVGWRKENREVGFSSSESQVSLKRLAAPTAAVDGIDPKSSHAI